MKYYSKGSPLFTENAFVAMQALSSRKATLCCLNCMQHIGNWKVQARFIGSKSRRKRDLIRSDCISGGDCLRCVNSHCDEVFCSEACLLNSLRNGHLLECGVDVDTICDLLKKTVDLISEPVIIESECTQACYEFRKHSLLSDELYLCARRVIVTLIAPHVLHSSDTIAPGAYIGDRTNSMKQTLEEFLNSFPPPTSPSSELTPEDIIAQCIQGVATLEDEGLDVDGTLHESWLLLTSSFLQLGISPTAFNPLMSFAFYKYLVRCLLPMHVKYVKCEGSEGHSPLQKRLLQACSDNEFELWANTYDSGAGSEGESEQWTTDGRVLWNASRLLFPSALKLSKTTSDYIEDTDTVAQSTSSCLALAIMASITQSDQGCNSDECAINGAALLDEATCTCLVLLPHCSRYARHSCLPSAQYFHCSVAALIGQPINRAHASEAAVQLPSSSFLSFFFEAERDFTCSCTPQDLLMSCSEDCDGYIGRPYCWWRGLCSCSGKCEDGLSISFVSDLSLDLDSRHRALNSIVSSYSYRDDAECGNEKKHGVCNCVRCQVEGSDDTSERSTLVLSNDISLMKSLGYLYMQIHLLKEARGIFRVILEKLDSEGEKCRPSLLLRGEVLHALGGTYLSEGDWRAACKTWSAILDCGDVSKLGSLVSYGPLHDELIKLDAFPVFLALVYPHDEGTDIKASDVKVQEAPSTHVTYLHDLSDNSQSKGSNVVLSQDDYHTIPLSPSVNAFLSHRDKPILTEEECRRVISLAEEFTRSGDRGWSTSRHYAVPTTDFPVQSCEPILAWFKDIMSTRIVPLIAFQLSKDLLRPNSTITTTIHVHDAFVVKYDSGQPISKIQSLASPNDLSSNAVVGKFQKLLPLHFDESSHSFVLSLNGPSSVSKTSLEGFEGGGTYFNDINKVVCPGAGHMVSFPGGKSLHGGAPVLRGIRYIIAAFLYIDIDVPCGNIKDEGNSFSKRSVSTTDTTENVGAPALRVKRPKIDFVNDQSHSFSFQF